METGKELDNLVATEVMGWTRHEGSVPLTWETPDGHLRTWQPTSFGSFRPSIDHKDVWEGVEKLIGEGFAFRISTTHDGEKFFYYVAAFSHGGIGRGSDEEYISYEADSVEAPHAICLAMLRAKGVWYDP